MNYLRPPWYSYYYTTLANLSTNYLVMFDVNTYDGNDGINYYTRDVHPAREIIHTPNLMNYLHVQADRHGIATYISPSPT